MHIALSCVTDARSMRAVIHILKQTDPDLSCIVIPIDLWLHLYRVGAASIFEWKQNSHSMGYTCEGVRIKVRL